MVNIGTSINFHCSMIIVVVSTVISPEFKTHWISVMSTPSFRFTLPFGTLRARRCTELVEGNRLSNGFFETFMAYAVGRDENAHKFSIANASKSDIHRFPVVTVRP